jgi:hypothetical protein
MMMLLAIALAVATTTGTANNSAPASPPPLREVVYNVNTALQINQTIQSFEQTAPATTAQTSQAGTVTIDVLAAGPDGTLAVRATENWQGTPRPVSFEGIVSPDGIVIFPPQTINDVTREILSYFGTKFVPDATITQGTRWHTVQNFANAQVETDYSVTNLKNDLVLIHEDQSVEHFNVSAHGDVHYDAATLAPVSGLITKRMQTSYEDTGSGFTMQADQLDTTSGGMAERTRILTLRFSLVSDTKGTSPAMQR